MGFFLFIVFSVFTRPIEVVGGCAGSPAGFPVDEATDSGAGAGDSVLQKLPIGAKVENLRTFFFFLFRTFHTQKKKETFKGINGENALLRLEPIKAVEACCELEYYFKLHQFKILPASLGPL